MKRFADRILKPIPLAIAYGREAAREIKSKVDVPVFLLGSLSQPSVCIDFDSCGGYRASEPLRCYRGRQLNRRGS